MYALISEIAEIDLLAPPFVLVVAAEQGGGSGQVYRCDDPVRIDRGLSLNRYTGEVVYVTPAVGFGEGSFGLSPFGWG